MIRYKVTLRNSPLSNVEKLFLTKEGKVESFLALTWEEARGLNIALSEAIVKKGYDERNTKSTSS